MLLITPTDWGTCADIRGVARACHEHDVPLIVDEAWGAVFPFHPGLPPWGMDAEADLVVVLAYMSASQAEGLRARLGSLADVVVVANSLGEPPAAALESPVALYSWYKTQMLGELRARIENGRLVAPEQRFVRMDEPLSRDPDVEALVERSSSEVRRARERRFAGG